jgi:hypothetical protein
MSFFQYIDKQKQYEQVGSTLQVNTSKAYMNSTLPENIVRYKCDSSKLPACISCTLPAIVVCYKRDSSTLLAKNYSLKNQEESPQMCPSCLCKC